LEAWATEEALDRASARFAQNIPGYIVPQAHGVGTADAEEPKFWSANVKEHELPAVVMATVCGYARGDRTYFLSPKQLSAAVRLLSPAEACPTMEHVNLIAWRKLLAHKLAVGERYMAVFIGCLEDEPVSIYDIALRHAISSEEPHMGPRTRYYL
jgi:hypothetical protein